MPKGTGVKPRNYQQFNLGGVLARLKECAGIRYTCSGLAQSFKVTPAEMVPMLRTLAGRFLIRTGVEGRDKIYWVPSQAELDLEVRQAYVRPFRPLQGYEASMRRFADMAEKGR
jgi:hypothetical protein